MDETVLYRGKRNCQLVFPRPRRGKALKRKLYFASLAAVLASVALVAGCHSLTQLPSVPDQGDPPAGDGIAASGDEPRDTSASFLSVMREGQWSLRTAAPGQNLAADAPRWRHPNLEDLLARPTRERPNFYRWLGHEDPVVAGNAAIALARLHDRRAAEPLAAAVRHPVLGMSIRRAAAEAFIPLGEREPGDAPVNRDQTTELVGELLAQYGNFRGTAQSRYLPGLHAELVRVHARLNPADSAPLVDALESPAAAVQLDALRSWPNASGGPLPTEVIELCSDVNMEVRAAALRLVVAGRSPAAHELLMRGLSDHQFQVRMVAIEGLGKLGGASSQASLQRLLDDQPATIRAAAVAALAEMDAWSEVYAAAEDSAWQVRKAVAAALRSKTGPRAVALADRLLDDASSQVGLQMVETVSHWPLAEAGPRLLAGMEAASLLVRKAATSALADRWGQARPFPYDAQPARRDTELAELKRDWLSEFDDARPAALPSRPVVRATVSIEVRQQIEAQFDRLSNPATPPDVGKQLVQALIDSGLPVVAVLESRVADGQKLPSKIYHDVLPELDPTFAILVDLESTSGGVRRRAAASLADGTRGKALSDLALARLVELVITEQDPLVWTSVEIALADDVRRPAVELHYVAMSHPAPEIRRRACDYLSAHGDRAHQGLLLDALADENSSVVLTAARGLAETGPLENAKPLERLLSRRDAELRLAAGTSLAKLGLESGEAALERLARSDDPNIRRKTAEVMGEVGLSVFVPTLIDLLDDRLGIKRTAIKSLVQIVGHDVATAEPGKPPNLNEQIARWRRWHAQR